MEDSNDNSEKHRPYGFVYLTTNLLNNKKYIGQRKYHTDNPSSDERYLGSGIQLQRAVRKYGRENFKRIILEECNSCEELNAAEVKWIAKYNAVEDKSFYNIAVGGEAGDTWSGRTEYKKRKFRKRIAESNKTRKLPSDFCKGSKNGAFGRHWYKDVKNRKQYFLHESDPLITELGLVRGMFRSKKHNEKISQANKGKRKNYVVHAKGKITVSKDGKVKFIPPEELEIYIANGYERGNVATRKQSHIYMNDGVKNHIVNKKKINHYLKLGYKIGRLQHESNVT